MKKQKRKKKTKKKFIDNGSLNKPNYINYAFCNSISLIASKNHCKRLHHHRKNVVLCFAVLKEKFKFYT